MECSVVDCPKPRVARSLCARHYQRWRRTGDAVAGRERGATAEERFWAKVDKSGDCWLWVGAIGKDGYGRFWLDYHRQQYRLVHRVSYEWAKGPIPKGLVVDHLCQIRICVRPDHLEAVTVGDNLRLGYSRKTHCRNGHEYTPENTGVGQSGGRRCMECYRRQASDSLARYRLSDRPLDTE